MTDRLRDAVLPPLLGALLGGACVGLVESLHILGQAFGTRDYSGIIQAVVLYGGAGLAIGCALAVGAVALTLIFGAAPDPSRSWTVSWIAVFCGGGFFVARWVVARDFVGVERMDTSGDLLVAGFLACFAVVFYLFARNALKKTFFSFLLHPAGSGIAYLSLVLFTLLFALGTALNNRARADVAPRPVAPSLLARPNLLLVVVEDFDLRGIPADELPRLAPTLARLQGESMRFTDATSHASTSRASFASLLTSLAPCAHGAVGPSSVLPEAADTVAEVLSRHGYTTGAVIAEPGASPSFNFGQGYDTFEFLRPRWLLRASEASYRLALQRVLHAWLVGTPVVAPTAERAYRDAGDVAGAGVDWLRRHGSERWFLTLQFSDPGLPLVEHPTVARLAAEPVAQASGGGGSPRVDRAALYRGEIAWLDQGLARVVEYLDQHDLLDVTAVVVVGLQGPRLEEGAAPLSDRLVQVPLLVRLPDSDRRAGRSIADPVRLVDVAPTLTELGGAGEGAGWQGVSLLREYALRTDEQKVALIEDRSGGIPMRGLRDGDWKLVREGLDRSGAARSLHFLDEDPDERDNLARRPVARWKVDQKLAQLADLEVTLCAPVASAPTRSVRGTPLSPEDCAVLRRLGFQEGFSERCEAVRP
jgi:arylsulfatase A-like enzyme